MPIALYIWPLSPFISLYLLISSHHGTQRRTRDARAPLNQLHIMQLHQIAMDNIGSGFFCKSRAKNRDVQTSEKKVFHRVFHRRALAPLQEIDAQCARENLKNLTCFITYFGIFSTSFTGVSDSKMSIKQERGQSPAPSLLCVKKIFHISYSKYTQKTASTCNQ